MKILGFPKDKRSAQSKPQESHRTGPTQERGDLQWPWPINQRNRVAYSQDQQETKPEEWLIESELHGSTT